MISFLKPASIHPETNRVAYQPSTFRWMTRTSSQRVEEQAGGKDKPVVVYCASQQCNSSEKAAENLENAGFTAVTDFAGGFKAWQETSEAVSECHSC